MAEPPEIHVFDHVPTVSVERALRGLAQSCTVGRITKLLREARFRKQLDMAELRRIVDACHKMRGHATIVEAIERFDVGDNGAWSEVEERGWDVLHDVVEDETPLQNQQLRAGDRNVIPDLRWVRSGVSVQLDGPPHLQENVLADDADADRALRILGDTVLRIPWFDLTRRRTQVRDDVRRLILSQRVLLRALAASPVSRVR